MKKVISNFSRSGGLLVFLMLEAICLFLVVNFNQEQREIYRNSKSIFQDRMTHGWGEVTQYWNLTAVNDSLSGVISDLRAEQDEAKFQNSIWRDSLREKRDNFEQQFTYTSAKVVSNTINLPNNFIVLDKGTDHGINTRMGVYDDRGIVGIVVASNKHYSRVMSILHRDTKISAEIKRLKAFGTLVWEKTVNPTMMDLKFIPKHIRPIVGDTIQTSGFSSHFPQGLPIGIVDEIIEDDRGSNFHEIKVRLSNDLSSTRYAYIVNNLFKEEFIEMQEGKKDE